MHIRDDIMSTNGKLLDEGIVRYLCMTVMFGGGTRSDLFLPALLVDPSLTLSIDQYVRPIDSVQRFWLNGCKTGINECETD
jgi:hypothetical protein